jgi:hypothetical protein
MLSHYAVGHSFKIKKPDVDWGSGHEKYFYIFFIFLLDIREIGSSIHPLTVR